MDTASTLNSEPVKDPNSELISMDSQSNDESISGIEHLKDLEKKLIGIVRINFKNKSALLRKATFSLLEYIASTNTTKIENLLISRVQ